VRALVLVIIIYLSPCLFYKKILGSAVLQAIRNFTDKGGPLYMVNIYNLLGDPTLEIK
jgi:hypothetical protein